MENKFTEAMSLLSDAQLLQILNEQRDDYQQEAIDAAEEELSKRNLSEKEIAVANSEIEERKNLADKRKNESLEAKAEIAATIITSKAGNVFSGIFKSNPEKPNQSEIINESYQPKINYKRPLIITITCILNFISTPLLFILIFNFYAIIPNPIFTIIALTLVFILMIGIWQMRKVYAYLYITFILISDLIYLIAEQQYWYLFIITLIGPWIVFYHIRKMR